MTVESMASPGALKRRLVLDSDAPDALGRKKGGNRRRESNASARAGRIETKSCRARCLPPVRSSHVCCLLLPRAVLFPCALLPRALPSAPVCCPPPVRSSPTRASFCSCTLPSSRVLSCARCPPHSIARHRPWLGSCHPCLSTGRESCLLSARGLLCSSAHGLLCSSLFLGMLLCSNQLCLALES
jgi:hypothetical protein